MTGNRQHLPGLIILYLLLLVAGIIISEGTESFLPTPRYILLLTIMWFITLGAYLVIAAGNRRQEKERGVFMIAAIGGKFLLYLILLLLFWIQGKNLSFDFIIAFFVLYLVLTIYLLVILFKSLKSN